MPDKFVGLVTAMGVYKRGRVWWYRFTWRGESVRETSKQTNKRVAEQMEAAHKTSLAKGEVGIREQRPIPTLKEFIAQDFLPFVRATKASKPNTLRFYETCVTNLTAYTKLSGMRLDEITTEHITGFVARRQSAKIQVSTLNADLATLRRIFHLAVEWGKTPVALPRVRMLPGANHRERVLNTDEEKEYLDAAAALGQEIESRYHRALQGIRALQRGETPTKPDGYLLRDAATILIDCGMRPEECFRLKWRDNVRDGAIEIHTGKGRASRRRIPCSQRVLSILNMRRAESKSEWLFPAETKSGHVEASSLKKQHAAALKKSGVPAFVLYTFRHTCITRWAKHMDPFTLHVIAGHADMNTTKRYVHPSDADVLEAMERVWGGHKTGHSPEITISEPSSESPVIN
jgi:integrase